MLHLKRTILFFVFALIGSIPNWACSCGEFPTFCDTPLSNEVWLCEVVKQGEIQLNEFQLWSYTTVALRRAVNEVEISYDTISLLNQDGVNCNGDITAYLPGDSLIVSINPQATVAWPAEDPASPPYPGYDLFGCGRYFLQIRAGMVGGLGLPLVPLTDFLNDPSENCPRPVSTDKVIEDDNELIVYPNPTTDQAWLTAEFDRPTTAILLDSRGQIQRRFIVAGATQEIPLASLPKGLYFLNLEGHGRSQMVRIIKQ